MAKQDKSPKIHQGPKVKDTFEIKTPEWTEKQKQIINTILSKESRIIFINGPAGVAKTYMAVYAALEMLRQKRAAKITYVRTAVESSDKSIGFLPGEAGDKIAPYARPLLDKLDEFLYKATTDKLIKDEFITVDLINFLRGASLNVQVLVGDEFQNASFKEIITVLTRFGRFSKFVICGDIMQSDINGKSGFKKVLDIFNDDESKTNGIHVFNLGKEDIMRSEELKFIIDKIERAQESTKAV